MKSGTTSRSSIARTIAMNSVCCPTQSLNPTGLPSASSRRRARKSISSSGVEKVRWATGEWTVPPTGTPRARAISPPTFAPGRMPPPPGLAPWESLSSIILTASRPALRA